MDDKLASWYVERAYDDICARASTRWNRCNDPSLSGEDIAQDAAILLLRRLRNLDTDEVDPKRMSCMVHFSVQDATRNALQGIGRRMIAHAGLRDKLRAEKGGSASGFALDFQEALDGVDFAGRPVLSDDEWYVAREHFGAGRTLLDIGIEYGLTPGRISQVASSARQKLRHLLASWEVDR